MFQTGTKTKFFQAEESWARGTHRLIPESTGSTRQMLTYFNLKRQSSLYYLGYFEFILCVYGTKALAMQTHRAIFQHTFRYLHYPGLSKRYLHPLQHQPSFQGSSICVLCQYLSANKHSFTWSFPPSSKTVWALGSFHPILNAFGLILNLIETSCSCETIGPWPRILISALHLLLKAVLVFWERNRIKVSLFYCIYGRRFDF